jgi:AcrR family transcriptional regulator
MSRHDFVTTRTKAGAMSGNGSRKPDARVARTRDRLGDAIIALILEKPFDAITVQEVLDRAGVGRSTFYAHYKDKDDVLISEVDEFFADVSMQIATSGEQSERLVPAKEFLRHLSTAQPLLAAFAESGRIHDVWDLAQAHFARGIEQRLAVLTQFPPEERAVRANALAGSFLGMIRWWLERGCPEAPDTLDELWHRTAWDGMPRKAGG